MGKKFFGTVEISKLLNFHQTTIAKWIDSNKLHSFKTVGGHRKVEVGDLIEFLQKNGMPIPKDLAAFRKKIFVIDDDKNFTELIKLNLHEELAAYQIDVLEDEVQALLRVGLESPEIILLDVFLPTINGIELFRKIKSVLGENGPKIIVISAASRDELLSRYPEIKQAEEVLQKPINFDDLKNKINKLMSVPADE